MFRLLVILLTVFLSLEADGAPAVENGQSEAADLKQPELKSGEENMADKDASLTDNPDRSVLEDRRVKAESMVNEIRELLATPGVDFFTDSRVREKIEPAIQAYNEAYHRPTFYKGTTNTTSIQGMQLQEIKDIFKDMDKRLYEEEIDSEDDSDDDWEDDWEVDCLWCSPETNANGNPNPSVLEERRIKAESMVNEIRELMATPGVDFFTDSRVREKIGPAIQAYNDFYHRPTFYEGTTNTNGIQGMQLKEIKEIFKEMDERDEDEEDYWDADWDDDWEDDWEDDRSSDLKTRSPSPPTSSNAFAVDYRLTPEGKKQAAESKVKEMMRLIKSPTVEPLNDRRVIENIGTAVWDYNEVYNRPQLIYKKWDPKARLEKQLAEIKVISKEMDDRVHAYWEADRQQKEKENQKH